MDVMFLPYSQRQRNWMQNPLEPNQSLEVDS